MPRSLISFLLAGLLPLVAACSPALAASPHSVTLTVFAAASLTEAFTEIGAAFRAEHPTLAVSFNFAASNQLAEQIGQGAPADVFASANAEQMGVAIAGGRVLAGAPQVFARNRLVVIFPASNPGGLAELKDLAQPGLRLVLAAEAVPVGRYSLDFLDEAGQDPAYGAGYKNAVLGNVVSYEENVKVVLTKVLLGEADAGIVYASDVTGKAADQVDRLDIPDRFNTIATYPIAPVGDSAQPEAARAFVDFVLSSAGQGILVDHGFLPTDDS